jgi:hypothetical protein
MFSKANQKKLQVTIGDTLNSCKRGHNSRYQTPLNEELEAVLVSEYGTHKLFEKMLLDKRRNIPLQIYGIQDSQKRIDIALNTMEKSKVGSADPFKFEKLL